jgi:hypothetical protein
MSRGTKRTLAQNPDDAMLRLFGIRLHPGWEGMFTRGEYPGAMRNGTRVEKINGAPTDSHPDGARATVLGSFGLPEVGVAYFVAFDDWPKSAVMVVAARVRPLDPVAVAMDAESPDNPGGVR